MAEETKEVNWGIIELMGRKVIAGQMQESSLLGIPLMRVDVPATSAFPAFTQFYGAAAVYGVTLTSEEVARRTAEHVQVNPVSVYVPDLVSMEQYNELREKFDVLQNALRKAQLASGEKAVEEEDAGEEYGDDPEN